MAKFCLLSFKDFRFSISSLLRLFFRCLQLFWNLHIVPYTRHFYEHFNSKAKLIVLSCKSLSASKISGSSLISLIWKLKIFFFSKHTQTRKFIYKSFSFAYSQFVTRPEIVNVQLSIKLKAKVYTPQNIKQRDEKLKKESANAAEPSNVGHRGGCTAKSVLTLMNHCR